MLSYATTELWQQLVRLAHGNNARRTYLKTIGALRKGLSEFNISALSTPRDPGQHNQPQAHPFPVRKPRFSRHSSLSCPQRCSFLSTRIIRPNWP